MKTNKTQTGESETRERLKSSTPMGTSKFKFMTERI